MTLRITVDAVKGMDPALRENASGEDVLIIIISKQGVKEYSEAIPIQEPILSKPFGYLCSPEGQLRITLQRNNNGTVSIMGKSTVNVNEILKIVSQWPGKEAPYDIFLSINDQKNCYLRSRIWYEPLKSYIGKTATVHACDFRKDLTGYVTFFKGPCKTLNMFSVLDTRADAQNFKFVETSYSEKDTDKQ